MRARRRHGRTVALRRLQGGGAVPLLLSPPPSLLEFLRDPAGRAPNLAFRWPSALVVSRPGSGARWCTDLLPCPCGGASALEVVAMARGACGRLLLHRPVVGVPPEWNPMLVVAWWRQMWRVAPGQIWSRLADLSSLGAAASGCGTGVGAPSAMVCRGTGKEGAGFPSRRRCVQC